MLIIMSLDSPREDIEKVKSKIEAAGCIPHEIPGADKLAIGITGPSNILIRDEFRVMNSVDDVVRVTAKYKLVSREMKEEDTVVNVGGNLIGSKNISIIAGPCAVENKQQAMDIAGTLKEMGVNFFRGGAFKPRSSPYSFQGLKEEGLQILDEVKNTIGMKIVTEVLNPRTIESVAEVADVIQIGARNMQNFTLLEEVGQTKKPVLLKRGMSATVEDLLLSAEYIVAQNNYNVILCERGIRTFETSTRNTLDLNAVPVIKKLSHLPVFVDPSHGIGQWDKVPAMSLAAVACGADGLMIEVHNNPEQAMSDGYQSLKPKKLKALLEQLKPLSEIVNRTLELK